METLNPLEAAILEKMLSGDKKLLDILRRQYLSAKVTERRFTGAGFFTNFYLPPEIEKLPDQEGLEIGDVSADIAGLENGADFVLFVRNGAIHMLEGVCYDEPWPEHATATNIFYNGLSDRKEEGAG